jgi:Protein of unknown function (DUF3014)
MQKTIGGVVILVLMIWGVAVYFLTQRNPAPMPQPMDMVETPDAPAKQSKPSIRYPIPSAEEPGLASKPLPSLAQSDQSIADALSDLIGSQPFRKLFRLDDIVRNIVVTIDNMPRQEMAARQLPVKPAGGAFLASGEGNSLSIAASNGARYKPYVRIVENLDAKRLAATYIHFYPLFQRAYQELGYPQQYFNDRLIDVIDHLLAAPEIEGPVALAQPHVLYRFADPKLEAESAGHKVMIRIGKENAAIVKSKLREIRRELTRDVAQK